VEGIYFVINDKGKRVAVQIDLERYGSVWEDFYDALIVEQRKSEPRESLEAVETRLVKQGKLRR
jgi:hypothetical protein